MIGGSGCICSDPRISKIPDGTVPIDCGEGGLCYVRTFEQCRKYISTNPVDYDAAEEWISRQCFGPK